METAITEVTSIRLQNDTEKATWKTRRYFVDFKSRIYVGTSTSNQCHYFHVDSPFKFDEISKGGIWTSNRWRFHKDVSIGLRRITLTIMV